MAGVETSEENDSSEKLVPKKKCTSEIWQERIQIQEKRRVNKCRYCVSRAEKTVVNVTSRGNATNLHSHLEHKHMELFEDFRKCKGNIHQNC